MRTYRLTCRLAVPKPISEPASYDDVTVMLTMDGSSTTLGESPDSEAGSGWQYLYLGAVSDVTRLWAAATVPRSRAGPRPLVLVRIALAGLLQWR